MAKTISSFSNLSKFIIGLALLLSIQACETPEKVLKSNDLDYKIKTATRWYEKKEYVKCIPVFEELMGLLKGTKSTEDIYYMYCWANYKQGDYLISAYHFNNFTKLYPASAKAEECAYMSAKSHAKLSPKPTLDQTNTFKAIETYQSFVNNYPESGLVDTANTDFLKLRKKLEAKNLSNAELYYKTENYKAAATSLKNILTDYPDIDNVDYIYFMIIKSYDKYAQNSIQSKKSERYNDVYKAFKDFEYRFPKSKYLDASLELANASHFKSMKAAFKNAELTKPELRSQECFVAIQQIQKQLTQITDEKEVKKANQMMEKVHIIWFKNELLLAKEATDKANQKKYLEQSIKTYYTFVDKFKDSKYAPRAEKEFLKASEQLKKINDNG